MKTRYDQTIFRVKMNVAYSKFNDNPNEYMIIIYDNLCSFQRCGAPEKASGEYHFESLDELYKAQQIDGIVLERDREKIRALECIDFGLLGLWD